MCLSLCAVHMQCITINSNAANIKKCYQAFPITTFFFFFLFSPFQFFLSFFHLVCTKLETMRNGINNWKTTLAECHSEKNLLKRWELEWKTKQKQDKDTLHTHNTHRRKSDISLGKRKAFSNSGKWKETRVLNCKLRSLFYFFCCMHRTIVAYGETKGRRLLPSSFFSCKPYY